MNILDFIAALNEAYHMEDKADRLNITLGDSHSVPVTDVDYCADCNEFHVYSKGSKYRHDQQHL